MELKMTLPTAFQSLASFNRHEVKRHDVDENGIASWFTQSSPASPCAGIDIAAAELIRAPYARRLFRGRVQFCGPLFPGASAANVIMSRTLKP